MQLSSRILTALAVLILAVAVVAVRAGSTGTVDAATGTIDVVNVGTCYTTDADVFSVSDCNDGDDNTGDNEGYEVAGRDSITETGTVYATYAYDPKTAPDSPRGVLENSNVLKISIKDPERDKRTPVLLATNAVTDLDTFDPPITVPDPDLTDDIDTTMDRPSENLQMVREDVDVDDLVVDNRSFRWQSRGGTATDLTFSDASEKVVNGITIVKGSTDGSTEAYKPMFTAGDDTPISLYGMYDADGDGTDHTAEFVKLNKYLGIDEDVGSGRNADDGEGDEVAPWFSVQVSVPANATAMLLYVVYQTSTAETLIGGYEETDDTDTAAEDGYTSAADAPSFTSSEKKAGSALLVEARSDGRTNSQNLRLKETSRFSGVYEGFVQLTDENGNDVVDGSATNWGLMTDDASSHEMGGAATLGVESGPVVIAYRDTDGATQTLSVEIDTVPPAVVIDTPENKSEGQDTSPEFSGAFNDSDSGLRKNSFRLYVDHTDDLNEDGANEADELALDLGVDDSGDPKFGYVTSDQSDGQVETTSEYAGYAAKSTYGVIGHEDLYLETNGDLKAVTEDPLADGDTNGTFADSVRITFAPEENYNNTIDFQALVADIAGNVGFSDSDDEGPRFINNLGVEEGKQKSGRYNVLGWYARHIFFLDEVPPDVIEAQTVTGFYGENDDDEPQANRSGVLVAFDKAVDPDSIDVSTFSVTLDGDAGAADVIDVDVDGRAVYLLLSEDLASDATPKIDIAGTEWVSDPAGNRLTGGDQEEFEASDGITPVLSVALSGGSGSGEGAEGPSKLTNDSIVITVDADEEINATPSLVVVCSNIAWGDDLGKDLSALAGARSGDYENSSANFSEPTDYDCDGDAAKVAEIKLQQVQTYSRPGLAWEYQWVNFDDDKALSDGKLTVVAYARDRQKFENLDGDDRHNWGSATAEFRYDNTLNDPATTPDGGATVTESRPFVLVEFTDAVTVSIDEFSVDGTAQEISTLGGNRFLYWPEELGIGSHTIAIDAVDAAGNTEDHEFSFKVAERSPFNLKLIAGWNAVSFPANPVSPNIEDVFTEDVVDMVAAWDASDMEKPWSIATRMEGEWATHDEFATLSKVHAQYGYWVHAQGFVTQRVQLIGGINRTDPNIVPPDLVSIPTLAGWNFVGVIDQDGDQTQANDGEELKTGDDKVTAGSYLGDNKRAYTWDAVRSEFKVLEDADYVTIGDGIWVYFGGGIAP